MMSKPRYLTKSRFKIALECPTKLFYTGKEQYLDQKLEDPFLTALAEGGFQVGELAKQYFPNGHDITSLDYEDAESQTQTFLQQEKVTLYEPTIRFKNYFIRIDILVKDNNHFDLIEVKAKSFDPTEGNPFLSSRDGTIKSDWKSYLYDIAFQKYVLSHCYPEYTIRSFLMMANKNAPCPTDGLNQKFRIVRDETNRKGVKVSSSLTKHDLEKKILIQVPVDEYIDLIFAGKDSKESPEKSFEDLIEYFSAQYEKDEKIPPNIGSQCASCEFKCTKEDEEQGLKSGFKECWASALNWGEIDFQDPNILDLWNFRKKDQFIQNRKIKLIELSIDDISPKEDKKAGLSTSERQWLQVEKVQNRDSIPFIDKSGLKAEIERWKYPLHFIDFETTAVALPFNKGLKPYEGITFQYSHHIVTEDGDIQHAGQYLNTQKGIFPNYEFIRKLKEQLDVDEGTIFRYAAHENTYLNIILGQINEENDLPDREELCQFIKSITKSVNSSSVQWEGERCMVDMLDLVKRYYYDPKTNGSNSIKYVLPALLNSSKYLQEKYSKKIYGAKDGIPSLNYKDWQWIKMKDGEVPDPYKLLPKLFQDISDREHVLLTEENELKSGDAALTAYARMQFEGMSEYEHNELQNALLKYCELDTFAMVLIYEGWLEMIK